MSDLSGNGQHQPWQPPSTSSSSSSATFATEAPPPNGNGGNPSANESDEADLAEPPPRFVVIAPHSEHQTRSQAAAAKQIVEFVVQTNIPGVEVVQLTTAGPTVLDLVNGKAFVGSEALNLIDAVYAQHYGTPPLPHWKAPEQHEEEEHEGEEGEEEEAASQYQQTRENNEDDDDVAPAYTQYTLYVNANHATSMSFASLVAENQFNINIGILSRTQPTSEEVANVERRNIRTATWIRYPTPNPKIKVVPCVEDRATGEVYEGQKAVNDFMQWFEQQQQPKQQETHRPNPVRPNQIRHNQVRQSPVRQSQVRQSQVRPSQLAHRPPSQPAQKESSRFDSNGKPLPIVPKVIGNSHAKITNEELLHMQERRKALLERRQPPAGRSQPKPVQIKHK